MWTLVASGPSIVDWIPAPELEEHALGLKCDCHPRKRLVMDGPHVVSVQIVHRVVVRA